MGLFGGKKKDADKGAAASGRKPVTEAPMSTRKSVRRVVPSHKGAAPQGKAPAPAPTAKGPIRPPAPAASAPPAAIEEPAAPPAFESDQLDLGSGSHPVQAAPTPARPPSTSPILASDAPDFGGSLGGMRSGPSRTGDQVLLEFLTAKVGLINAEQANAARAKAEGEGLALDAAVVSLGFITEEQLVNSLSQETWVPHLKVDKYEIRKKALDTVARDDAQHFGVFPVDKLGNLLTLAMVNPLDVEAIRQLEAKTGLDIKKVVATRSEVASAIDKYYGGKAVASEGSRSFSQDVGEAPKSATQMLARSIAPEPAALAPEPAPLPSIAPPAHDIAADIQDIDDLLGGEETIAPAILEPVSIKPEESNDALELTDAPITGSFSNEFGLQDAPKTDTGALARSETPPLELPSLDLEKTDAIVPPPAPAPIAAPTPIAPETIPAVPAPAASPTALPPPVPMRQAGAKPATARFTAGKGAAGSKLINLVPVLEEEFRYAISHGKAKVFERWVALQSRNRIVNAVQVERELDGTLAGLYATPRKAG